MSELKPLASLGPVLLARKGGAKPAMRSGVVRSDVDDEQDSHGTGQSANDQEPAEIEAGVALEAAPAEPEIKRQQSALLHRIADANSDAATQAIANETRQQRRPAVNQGRRAAFTLRLDPKRHLKLKLASTIGGVSAQQLVTQALDKFLSEMPEIETLAAQVKRDGDTA